MSRAVPSDPRSRIEALRAEIRRADHAYHVLDKPVMADSEYDALFRELERLEQEHPELRDPTSPTERLPGGVAEGFKPFVHPAPMVSIDNVTSETEFRDW